MTPGTNVYSVVFILVALIVAVLAINWLYKLWLEYSKRAQTANENSKPLPNVVAPVIATLVVVTIYICVVTLGWSALQGFTTNMSHYVNPHEAAEQKAVDESTAPTKDEMDQTRAEQKVRAQEKPHQEALSSFDEAMKREADKIRQRNSTSTTSTATPASK